MNRFNLTRGQWTVFYRRVRCGGVDSVDAIRAHGVSVNKGYVSRISTWDVTHALWEIRFANKADMSKADRRSFIEVMRRMRKA